MSHVICRPMQACACGVAGATRGSRRSVLCAVALASAVLAAGALFGTARAGAFALIQCEGSSITAQGGGLQTLAQGKWSSEFNLNSNPAACDGTQGSFGKPTVTYIGSTGKKATEAWEKHEEYGVYPFVTKGIPPTAAAIKKLEVVAKFPARAGTLLSIPVAQTAIAIIVHLPASCTATSTPAPGRLVLTNATLEALFRGTTTTWSAISDSGDTVSGVGCNPGTHIKRVVPKEPQDAEGILKKYLFLIDNAKVFGGLKTWQQIAEGPKWPEEKPDPVLKSNTVEAAVAATPSTIGLVWVHAARASFGAPGHGAGTAQFWAEIQDGAGPTYADPSNNGDEEAAANSNCKETEYGNGGKALPTAGESWAEVSALTTEVHYTVCGLTYALAFDSYSAYAGAAFPPSEPQARTVFDYLQYVLNLAPGGGQPLIGALGSDYSKLPAAVYAIAAAGASAINY